MNTKRGASLCRHLERIKIEGFKSIRSADVDALNVLIAANGSGKSNFINFLRFSA